MLAALRRWLRWPNAHRPAKAPDATPPELPSNWALGLLQGEVARAEAPVVRTDAPPPAPRILSVRNRMGSVDHYYHFILGFVAPLLLRPQTGLAGVRAQVRSCGILDDKLRELQISDIDIVPYADWVGLKETAGRRLDQIFGYDHPDHYDAPAFARLRSIAMQRLGLTQVPHNPRIVIVNRGESPSYYQTAPVPSNSANLRRSVPNMPDLVEKLEEAGRPTEVVELENSTLKEQVRLFAGARIVVAQHGAALVNMVWMEPGGLIVEILPAMGTFTHFFSKLAQACGHRYVAVAQSGNHAPVDPTLVVAALQADSALSWEPAVR